MRPIAARVPRIRPDDPGTQPMVPPIARAASRCASSATTHSTSPIAGPCCRVLSLWPSEPMLPSNLRRRVRALDASIRTRDRERCFGRYSPPIEPVMLRMPAFTASEGLLARRPSRYASLDFLWEKRHRPLSRNPRGPCLPLPSKSFAAHSISSFWPSAGDRRTATLSPAGSSRPQTMCSASRRAPCILRSTALRCADGSKPTGEPPRTTAARSSTHSPRRVVPSCASKPPRGRGSPRPCSRRSTRRPQPGLIPLPR